MRTRLVTTVGVLGLALGLLAVPLDATKKRTPSLEVIASGLDNPRGLTVGPDNAIYVAEAGRGGPGACIVNGAGATVCYGATGAITRIGPQQARRIISGLPSLAPTGGNGSEGPHDVIFDRHGQGIATIGLGADPNLRAALGPAGARFARLLRFRMHGAQARFAEDLGAYENAANPAGGTIDSNPFGLTRYRGSLAVADAGGNDVLQVDDGVISTLAVFANRPVPGPGGVTIPMQPVPTSVAEGPDGALYVGQLTGFPFPPGGAVVFRVGAGGTPEEYATGFTNIIDIAFGRDRSLYVLQISAAGLLSGNPMGALIRVAPDGTRTEIFPGALVAPGGLAIGRDGSIYVSRFATLAGAGDVVRIRTSDF